MTSEHLRYCCIRVSFTYRPWLVHSINFPYTANLHRHSPH